MNRLSWYTEKTGSGGNPVQRKADTFNSAEGDLEGYDCKLCRNKGSIAAVGEGDRLVFRRCDCMEIRKSIHAMERSGLGGIIREMTFDTFHTEQPWQKKLLALVQAYARQPKGWLLLCGQVGSGKTHLCTAVCRQLLYAGESVQYMSWREEVTRLKALTGDHVARSNLMDRFKQAKILYIDDLFKCGHSGAGEAEPTGADVAIAFELINYRYINRMTTLVSSEFSPQKLVRIDEATGSRIIEMAGQNVCYITKAPERNYRMRGVTRL